MTNCQRNSIEEYDDISTRDQYSLALSQGLSPEDALARCARQKTLEPEISRISPLLHLDSQNSSCQSIRCRVEHQAPCHDPSPCTGLIHHIEESR